jgi:hypothetical protein
LKGGKSLVLTFTFFMCWSQELTKHRLRDNSVYNEHVGQYVICPRFRWWGTSRLIRTMAGITEATLPRKRAVYNYVREDGVVANCMTGALTESDFRRKCVICGKKFKSKKHAYAHQKSHGDVERTVCYCYVVWWLDAQQYKGTQYQHKRVIATLRMRRLYHYSTFQYVHYSGPDCMYISVHSL